MFHKSENTIRWAINLASLLYQSIIGSQMSLSEIGFKAEATICVLMSTLKFWHKTVWILAIQMYE